MLYYAQFIILILTRLHEPHEKGGLYQCIASDAKQNVQLYLYLTRTVELKTRP
jgi:hypothetical protein